MASIPVLSSLVIDGTLTVQNITAGVSDYDRFLVSDGGLIKYRTGAQLLSDIGGQASGSYLTTTTNFGGDVSGTYNAIVVANDSHTHDGRYYTESESDAKYLLNTTDTLTGDLTVTGDFTANDVRINNGTTINPSNGTAKTWALIQHLTTSENLAFSMYGDDTTDRMSWFTDYNNTGTFTERLSLIAQTGYFGINQTVPSYTLDVSGVIRSDRLLVDTLDNSSISADWAKYDGYGVLCNRGSMYLTNSGNIIFQTNNSTHSGTNPEMIINTGGNISIGNTNDTYKLDVSGNVSFENGLITTNPSLLGSNITTMLLKGGSGDNTRSGGIRVQSNNATLDGAMYFLGSKMRVGTVTNQAFEITTNNTVKMLVNAGGNVSIGGTGNTYKLDVSGTGYYSGDLIVNGGNINTGTSQQRVKLGVWSDSNYGIGMGTTYTYGGLNGYAMTLQMDATVNRGWWWGQSTHTNAQGAMALTNAGLLTIASYTRIGYGVSDTTTPGTTYMLQVNGDIQASDFVLSSDKKLKTNIKKLSPSTIDTKWKTFEFKSKKGKKRFGVIAQELEKTHPEFVITDEDGLKSVSYIDLLIAKNAELEDRITKLESLIKKLI